MGPRRVWCFVSLLFYFFLFSCGKSVKNISAGSLDSVIQDYAFKAVLPRRTGVVYEVPLPSNLSGMGASVVKLRSRTFWMEGKNISAFHFPPGTIPMPFVRRLVLVCENLGNWSSPNYDIPGYSLLAPVVGLLAYDASNISSSNSLPNLDLRATRDPISVSFPMVQLPKAQNSTIKCARFGLHGLVQLENMTRENLCFTRNVGHFAIVVSLEVAVPPTIEGERKVRRWWIWVVACGGGVVGILLLSLAGLGLLNMVRRKKIEEMERKAEEGEAWQTVWVGGSRMPSAGMMRTHPTIENDNSL